MPSDIPLWQQAAQVLAALLFTLALVAGCGLLAKAWQKRGAPLPLFSRREKAATMAVAETLIIDARTRVVAVDISGATHHLVLTVGAAPVLLSSASAALREETPCRRVS